MPPCAYHTCACHGGQLAWSPHVSATVNGSAAGGHNIMTGKRAAKQKEREHAALKLALLLREPRSMKTQSFLPATKTIKVKNARYTMEAYLNRDKLPIRRRRFLEELRRYFDSSREFSSPDYASDIILDDQTIETLCQDNSKFEEYIAIDEHSTLEYYETIAEEYDFSAYMSSNMWIWKNEMTALLHNLDPFVTVFLPDIVKQHDEHGHLWQKCFKDLMTKIYNRCQKDFYVCVQYSDYVVETEEGKKIVFGAFEKSGLVNCLGGSDSNSSESMSEDSEEVDEYDAIYIDGFFELFLKFPTPKQSEQTHYTYKDEEDTIKTKKEAAQEKANKKAAREAAIQKADQHDDEKLRKIEADKAEDAKRAHAQKELAISIFDGRFVPKTQMPNTVQKCLQMLSKLKQELPEIIPPARLYDTMVIENHTMEQFYKNMVANLKACASYYSYHGVRNDFGDRAYYDPVMQIDEIKLDAIQIEDWFKLEQRKYHSAKETA
jgi:hypothetical protein